nr:ubiquitin-conjugating enzyme E2 34-like [Tanacetum cinerariifolium]
AESLAKVVATAELLESAAAYTELLIVAEGAKPLQDQQMKLATPPSKLGMTVFWLVSQLPLELLLSSPRLSYPFCPAKLVNFLPALQPVVALQQLAAQRMAEKACVKRLQKEYRALCKEPVSHVVARPSPNDILEWHYVLEGSQGTPFAGGYYYGKIKFPPEYPFKPPGIR